MKKILFLITALLIALFSANAHCYPAYMWTISSTLVGPGTVSTSYSGNKNFISSVSGTTVFSTACNFNSWNKLNFESRVYIKAPINFPIGKGEIGFYGINKADYITMNDSDVIYVDGDFEVITLISNNSKPGQYNTIWTDSYVTIGGTKYYPRDTFYSTPGNKETAVIITDCKGTSLPIKLNKYSGKIVEKGVEIIWETPNNNVVNLHYSIDGKSWTTLYNVNSPFLITERSTKLFVRISIENEYSETLVFNRELMESYEIYNLYGTKLISEPVNQVFIKKYSSGRCEKFVILNN